MTEYHRFADKTDRVHKALSAKAKSFITHVESCLPSGREKWWTAFSPNGERKEERSKQEKSKQEKSKQERPEENRLNTPGGNKLEGSSLEEGRLEATQTGPDAAPMGPEEAPMGPKEALTEVLMFEAEPYSEALRCARRLDEPWSINRAQQSVRSSSSVLKFRAEQIRKRREQYLNLLIQEDQIRRKGEWGWYETVRTVRNAAWKNDLCPLVQVNRLQATFQKGVELRAGFPETLFSSLGEAALEGLAIRNQPIQNQVPGPSHRAAAERWEDLSLQDVNQDSKIEDAIWALFLSIASGDRVPGGLVHENRSKWTGPHGGACIFQN